MPSSLIRSATRGVLFGSVCLCAGCGATGLDWVAEAHLESAHQQRVNAVSVSNSRVAMSGSIPATAEQAPSEPRPRLNRTLTLGEIDVAAASADAGPAAAPGTSVNVYNYNQVNVVTPAFGYGAFGYARTQPGIWPGHVPAAPSRSSAPSPQPGQNWPAVADHGPSFPFSSAPASPWTRTR
ncbi:MAG: hypothetical protein WDO74_03345 [Pseudomonadota bacterium]